MNVVEAGVLPDGDGVTLQVGTQTLAVDSELLTERPAVRSTSARRWP